MKEGAADRLLRPGRATPPSLLFGGRALPTIIRDPAAGRSWLARRWPSATSASSATASTRWKLRRSLRWPWLRGLGSSRVRGPSEARLSRLGFRLRSCSISSATWSWRLLASADRARHVPEGHRRRQQRPAVAVRRQQRLLGGRVLPQARRQCQRGRHGDQPGRRDRRGRGIRQQAGIPVLSTIPATRDIRRRGASYEIIGRPAAWGPMFAELADNVGASLPVRPHADVPGSGCSGCSKRQLRWAATWCWSRRRSSTCAAGPSGRSRPSKSSTTNAAGLRRNHSIVSRQGPHRAGKATASGRHSGGSGDAAAARTAGKSGARSTPKDYPTRRQDPRPAAEHVPGVRLAARGLRMRRTATILSGSACCVYGLTFTSLLRRAAQRGYVPFNPNRWSPANCSRTSATATGRPTRHCTTPSSSSTCACRPAACRCRSCRGDQWGADHRHRRARDSACPRMPRPGRAGGRDAEVRRAGRWRDLCTGAAHRTFGQADDHAAGRDVWPIPSSSG